jgi:hypothetical protein
MFEFPVLEDWPYMLSRYYTTEFFATSLELKSSSMTDGWSA